MTKVSVGNGVGVRTGKFSTIKVLKDGAFVGLQPQLNFIGNVTVTNNELENRVDINISGGGGAGDVTGPSSAVNNNFAAFDGITGKLIKDANCNSSSFDEVGAAAAAQAAAIAASQPLDSDLTAIAGLTPANDDFIQRKSGAWTNRTKPQVRADLLDTKQYARFYGDFGAMLAPYVNSASGTGATAAISSIAGTAGNPGTATCQTGSTSSGQAYVTLSASFNNFLLGGGSWFFDCVQYINVLSTLAERFVVIIGYHDSPSTSDATDGCYFRYSDNVNSGNWQAITRSNSVETGTVTDTGVAPVAATYQRFTIEVNAAGTQVTYYINGTQVAQHSANIPTGAGRQATWCAGIRKTTGSTAMSTIIDYMNTINELTTAR